MFWDDIELLKAVDRLESEHGRPVWRAEEVMSLMTGREVLNEQERAGFARELTLARDAGLLAYEFHPGYGQATPRVDEYAYLQAVSDLRLTISGRDRARGRIVTVRLDDVGADDGRAIAGLTLEHVARVIGDTYTDRQIPQFLLDSGVPPSFVPSFEGTKWTYVQEVLLSLLEGGAAARRSLRTFLGRWLEDELHTGPTENEKEIIRADLARQGWHVREKVLVVGSREFVTRSTPADDGAFAPDLSNLHPAIQSGPIRNLYADGHRASAILEAFKLVATRVKDLTGVDEDGTRLMARVFNRDHPVLRLNAGMSRTDRDEQEGFMLIFMGAMLGIRNPKAHDPFIDPDADRAMEYLSLASLLLRRLDDARLEES